MCPVFATPRLDLWHGWPPLLNEGLRQPNLVRLSDQCYGAVTLVLRNFGRRPRQVNRF